MIAASIASWGLHSVVNLDALAKSSMTLDQGSKQRSGIASRDFAPVEAGRDRPPLMFNVVRAKLVLVRTTYTWHAVCKPLPLKLCFLFLHTPYCCTRRYGFRGLVLLLL